MKPLREQATDGTSEYLELDADQWRDLLDEAATPSDRVGQKRLASCRAGAAGPETALTVRRDDVLAVCDMADRSRPSNGE